MGSTTGRTPATGRGPSAQVARYELWRHRLHDLRRSGARRAAIAASGARYRVDPALGSVALTFDDGPDPEFTPLVLDTLQRLGVRATFFCVGISARAHPELVRRMASEGHAVGSHSAEHPMPGELRGARLVASYRGGRESVEEAAGTRCRLFRPPQGHLSLEEARAIRQVGLRTWLWTRDLEDWRPGATPEEIVARTGELVAGDVLLLHDALEKAIEPSARDRSSTVAALPEVVARVRAQGLGFTVVG